jgi:hypothetical protein
MVGVSKIEIDSGVSAGGVGGGALPPPPPHAVRKIVANRSNTKFIVFMLFPERKYKQRFSANHIEQTT